MNSSNKNKGNKENIYMVQQQKNTYLMDFNRMRSNNYHLKLPKSYIQPYFEKLEEHLISYIEKSAYVIGCVAWLTNSNIIETLENILGSKIIINKEEYLNSDMEIGQKFFYQCLRGKYNEIPDMFNSKCKCCAKIMYKCSNFCKIFGNIKNNNNNCSLNDTVDNKIGSILTCGIVNNYSKMHHKFLIFFNDKIEPTGVWTGSYNLSKTSNFSLENALYITDQDVIMEYIKEFLAIYPFSESHNWKSGVLCKSI
jgi:hypothetical protein